MKGRAYYHCRGNDNPDPCRPLVREDRLLPWAEALLAALDPTAPTTSQRLWPRGPAPDGPATGRRTPSPSLTQASPGSGSASSGGHIDEDAYRAEWARLRAQREELVSRTAERAPPRCRWGA